VKPSTAANDILIDRAIETWQPRAERDLSREDARQIVENVSGFFSILVEWSRAEMSEQANDTSKSGDTDSNGEVRHDR
jgi:hypothetical protein